MKITVEITLDKNGAKARLSTETRLQDGFQLKLWHAAGRAFTVRELDDIWAALIDELDVQQVLQLGR